MTLFYYVILFVAALIFSTQFLITRQYQRAAGTGFLSSLRLSIGAYTTIAIFFLIKGSISAGFFNFGFSIFTLVMTLLIAVSSLLCVYMGIKALSVGNMSVYSVFMMLGSLILPSLTGLLFFNEKLNLIKALAIILMIVAILLSISGLDKGRLGKKPLLYYLGIFIMNGLIGVFFTLHQNYPKLTAAAFSSANGDLIINNDVFMTWYGLSTVVLCGVVYALTIILTKIKKLRKPVAIQTDKIALNEQIEKLDNADFTTLHNAKKSALLLPLVLLPILYGLCNGLGDYFIALATLPGALGSSVTFPIINGGTILFSSLCGIVFYKEKVRLSTVTSLVLVVGATIMFYVRLVRFCEGVD